MSLIIDTSQSSSVKPTKCHVLPCKIAYTGQANVTEYFEPQKRKEKLEAYFHGRRLVGHEIDLPPGYTGLVLEKSQISKIDYGIANDEDENMEDENVDDNNCAGKAPTTAGVVGRFQSVTLWGHEGLPELTTNPWSLGITDWMALAEIMNQ